MPERTDNAAQLPLRCDPCSGARGHVRGGLRAAEYFGGSTTGLGAAWAHCQFRLYDDNDGEVSDAPEVSHVFSEDDWFLGGLNFWLTPSELELLGIDAHEGVKLQKQIDEHFYFGAIGTTLAELLLHESSYEDFVFDPEEGPSRVNQSYHIFRPGSLSPGIYEWRYEQTLPVELEILFPGEPFVAHGVVQIIAG